MVQSWSVFFERCAEEWARKMMGSSTFNLAATYLPLQRTLAVLAELAETRGGVVGVVARHITCSSYCGPVDIGHEF